MLVLAAKKALPKDKNDPRSFWIGCIAIRKDGVKISSRNGAVHSTTTVNYQLIPSSHAEGRIVKKIDKGATLYISRVLRRDGSYAMAKPCPMCSITIKSHKVKKVFFTIDNLHFGVWNVADDTYYIFDA